ncbi:MAG: hypothetical protein NTU47_01860 [Ignavibacteriales bacterium]|nr:hypothetical protein [Ignavibacteriales bacterium]
MNMTRQKELLFAILALLLVVVPATLFAQTAPATSTVNYPGGGVIQAGDTWESFLPMSFTPSYSDAGTYLTQGYKNFIRLGNFDRAWSTPATHWPAAWFYTNYWYKNAWAGAFDPDPNFCPTQIGGKANPSYFSATAGGNNYAQVQYMPTLQGGTDAARHYTVEPYWVDNTRRQHAVYEAAFPSNLGLDVKMRAHGFQGPNWNNLNDFVILEIEFKNTGVLDMNMDGVAEKVNNTIKALAFSFTEERYMSVGSYGGGGRNNNDITLTPLVAQGAWVEDADASGSPWAFATMYPACSVLNPTAGNVDIGFNTGARKWYTDTWSGFVIIDVKSGSLPTDRSKSVVGNATKQTIYGTDPIGVGAQRGWYMSSGSQAQLWGSSNPKAQFLTATGAWFLDAGRSRQTDATNFNLSPNPNFFSGGIAGDMTTFVPKTTGAGRPDGDFKSTNIFDNPSYEDGKADATTNYPTGWGKFSKGASNTENFNGDMFAGVGPFSLAPGESMVITMATVAGFRLEGIQKAVRAARWAYAQNYVLPVLPPLPDMKVTNTLTKSVAVEWDTRAEAEPGFAGYKIYKSSQYLKKYFLEDGMRVSDRYQENMTPGPLPANLKKPVNPKFDAFGQVNATASQGSYQPDTWGTWDLVAVIPTASKSTYATGASPGYTYRYEDKDVVLGFSYWYYVAAYKEGTFTGPDGETTTRIETHSTNRNGATGLWALTYPFAIQNANFGKTATTDAAASAAGMKNVGAVQIVYSALAPAGSVGTVGVRPNPYKRAALHDNRANVYDHKLLFYNLPPSCKITITDVSGQIIDVINFSSTDANRGSTFWDMFSKDGLEVASGLYLYVVESPTGDRKIGQFSILR